MTTKSESILYDVNGNGGYCYQGIKDKVHHVVVPKFVDFPHGFIRKVLHFLIVGRFHVNGKLLEWITGNKGYCWLTTLNDGDRILLHDTLSLRTLQAVSYITPPNVRKYLYHCNALSYCYPNQDISLIINKVKKMGYQIVSFDQKDALKYNLIYAPQFYRFPDQPTTTEIKYDFFFCGLKKDRGEIIDNLKKQLSSKGFRCVFIVPDNYRGGGINYEQYLEYIRESTCIVDITQEGQAGFTRRPIEALFFNKKILTNNNTIANADFYRKSNVFILNQDNMNNIDTWLKKEIEIIPDEIKKRYDVNTWLENFK